MTLHQQMICLLDLTPLLLRMLLLTPLLLLLAPLLTHQSLILPGICLSQLMVHHQGGSRILRVAFALAITPLCAWKGQPGRKGAVFATSVGGGRTHSSCAPPARSPSAGLASAAVATTRWVHIGPHHPEGLCEAQPATTLVTSSRASFFLLHLNLFISRGIKCKTLQWRREKTTLKSQAIGKCSFHVYLIFNIYIYISRIQVTCSLR